MKKVVGATRLDWSLVFLAHRPRNRLALED